VVGSTDFRTCKRALLKLGARKAYYYETRKGSRMEAKMEGAGVETEKGAAAGVVVKDEGLSFKVLKGSMARRTYLHTYRIEQNFGDEIVRKMKNYPSEKIIIHDTVVLGRPNVPEMTVEAVRRWSEGKIEKTTMIHQPCHDNLQAHNIRRILFSFYFYSKRIVLLGIAIPHV
jgi:hypothetical protein